MVSFINFSKDSHLSTDLPWASAENWHANVFALPLMVSQFTLFHRRTLCGADLEISALRLRSVTMATCSFTVDIPGAVSTDEIEDTLLANKRSKRELCLVDYFCICLRPFSEVTLMSFSLTLTILQPRFIRVFSQSTSGQLKSPDKCTVDLLLPTRLVTCSRAVSKPSSDELGVSDSNLRHTAVVAMDTHEKTISQSDLMPLQDTGLATNPCLCAIRTPPPFKVRSLRMTFPWKLLGKNSEFRTDLSSLVSDMTMISGLISSVIAAITAGLPFALFAFSVKIRTLPLGFGNDW